MKEVLVVYFTRTGRSEKLAGEIGIKLNAKVDEISSKINYEGFFGFIRAGYRTLRKKQDPIKYQEDPSKYKVVIIVSPIWASNIPPAIRKYINDNIKNIKNYGLIIIGAVKDNRKAYNKFIEVLSSPVSEYVAENKDIEYEIFHKYLEDFADRIRILLEKEEKGTKNEQ